MTGRYILVGQTPVPCEDLLTWARWIEENEEARRVFWTRVLDTVDVSTVFLGLDHGFGGRPLLFETMAFWDGEHGEEMMRCSTWSEAERQHAAMIRRVARPASFLAYFRRYFVDWREGARYRWRRAWMDLQGIEPSEWDLMRDRIEDRF